MKNLKSLLTLVICAVTLTATSSHCFFGGNSNNWATGAAIGGIAGGRKGAAIGLGVGAFTDIASSAANNRSYDNGYYNNNYNVNYQNTQAFDFTQFSLVTHPLSLMNNLNPVNPMLNIPTTLMRPNNDTQPRNNLGFQMNPVSKNKKK